MVKNKVTIFLNKKNIPYTIAYRSMLTSKISLVPQKNLLSTTRSLSNYTCPKSKMSTLIPIKIKKNSLAAKELASDDTGTHPQIIEEICDKVECEILKCKTLCSPLKEAHSKGHFTHGPIAGKFSRFVNDYDSSGKKRSQYFTNNSDKNKKIDKNKYQNYSQKKEIKKDPKMEQYLTQKNLYQKIDD